MSTAGVFLGSGGSFAVGSVPSSIDGAADAATGNAAESVLLMISATGGQPLLPAVSTRLKLLPCYC